MDALLRSTLLPDVARTAMTTGHRYTAEEALAARIVDTAAPGPDVLPRAVQWATATGAKRVDVLAAIKDRLHADVVASLHGD
jgi:enoyl-CoA hydratase/carnithine racemase